MTSWHPWRELRNRPHITLTWARIPTGQRGAWVPLDDGQAVIILRNDLGRRARRATLTHELIHDERGLTTSDMPPLMAAKEEAIVERITTRRLVPDWALEDLAALGEPVTVQDIADAFDVPLHVAQAACRHLSTTA